MYIYIYVYVYMCICVCVYVYMYTRIYVYIFMIIIYMCVNMWIWCWLCVYVYIYICVKHHIVAGYLRFAMILSAKTWNLLNPEYGIRCGVKTTHVGQGGSFTSWSIQRLMESINSIAEQIRFRIHFKRFRLTCLQSLHLDGTLGLAEYYCVLLHHTPISTSVLLENLSANHDPPLEKILKVCFYSCTLLAVYFVGLLGIVASGFCIACFFFVLLWSTAIGLDGITAIVVQLARDLYYMGMGQNLLIMWYKGWPSILRFTGGTGFWPTSTWCHTTWIYMMFYYFLVLFHFFVVSLGITIDQ
jgi:hypothetical protein